MNEYELKTLIESLVQDVTFEYDGKYACINPWNKHKFEVGFDDKCKTYDNIDDVMNDKFYDGKSLKDICENIEFD